MIAEGRELSPWEAFFAKQAAAQGASPAGAPPNWDPLVPGVDLPLGQTSVYRTVSITSLPETVGTPMELQGPVDVLSDKPPLVRAPAEGVLLTHEQAWRMKGVTLGRLLHSLTLAPGEVTQVAVTGWRRSTQGRSAEQLDEEERAAQEAGRQRGVHDVTVGVASETQFGSSTTAVASAQVDGGIGGVLGFLGESASGSANTATASVVSFNAGARNVSADSNQSVRQATQQHASNNRSHRAALVQEVSQSETEQFQTRVVANYNHTHSLNMLYFEVLQVFELSTRVTDARRCIFLPMEIISFDKPEVVVAYAGPLATAARALGQVGLAAAIERIDQDQKRTQLAFERLEASLKDGLLKKSDLERDLKEASLDIRQISVDFIETFRKAETLQQAQRDNSVQTALRSVRHGVSWSGEDFAALRERGKAIEEDLHKAISDLTSQQNKLALATHKAEELKALLATADANLRSVDARRLATEEAAKHVAPDVLRQLNDQKRAFNQAMWAQLDPTQVAAMVAGKEHDGVSLTQTIDPEPVAVVGNYVGFRWNFPADEQAQADAFLARHLHDDDGGAERDTVVLPTGGVFAEAVPGRANSAEKIDLTRYWKWDGDTIPILPTAISRLHHVARARQAEARPGTLGAPAVSLKPLPDAPAGPAHMLASMVGTSLFRDLSGSEVIGTLLKEAQKVTGTGALEAQQRAHENISAFLDHVEALAPKVADFLQKQTAKSGEKKTEATSPSNLGGLKNALGEGAEGLDAEALVGEAAELGLLL